MFPSSKGMTDLRPIEKSISIANGQRIQATHVGNITLGVPLSPCTLRFLNALVVPALAQPLILISSLSNNGIRVFFKNTDCLLMREGVTLFFGQRKGNLYILSLKINLDSCCNQVTLSSWHERLGHPSAEKLRALRQMYREHKINEQDEQCLDCLRGKIRRSNFKREGRTKHPLLHSVHADICGPFQVMSLGGGRYFMLMTEATSRFTKAVILGNRDSPKIMHKIINFIKYLENVCCIQAKVHKMLTDNALEFKSDILLTKLRELGISKQYTIPHTPQSSGLVERMNSVVLSKIRTFISYGDFLKRMWGELTCTAIYLFNRMLSSHTPGKSPLEMLTGKRPSIKYLMPISCKVVVKMECKS
jgi:hypothetical protein